MIPYRIKIELLSDLCVSDGGVYNSSLDIDVCYDRYGFPTIPGKRLRGCLREAALELNDWGVNINTEYLFGTGKEGAAHIRLSSAQVEGYEEIVEVIRKNKDAKIFHPQNVLGCYCYIRTQNSIDYETGVSKDKTLRTMRVVKKGTVFYADVQLPEDKNKVMEFLKCCYVMKHMGISRTRGLGEVKLSVFDMDGNEIKPDSDLVYRNLSSKTIYEECPDADCLEYTLYLKEPVICKSVNGGEANSLDYIDGGKIFGLVANAVKDNDKENFDLFKQNDLVFSNAYLSTDGKRLQEVPACYYNIKDNKEVYVNKSHEKKASAEDKNEKKYQLNQMKHCYISVDETGILKKYDVDMEEHYHHRRPSDKSIGRAYSDDNEDSKFYQISSISAGQEYKGFLMGSCEQITAIVDALKKNDTYYIGYGRSSEYGKVELRNVTTKKVANSFDTLYGRRFMITLLSPTIIYGDNAMYTTDRKYLKEEILYALELENEDSVKMVSDTSYINYADVAGYNVTWRKNKPVIECFDKGTVLILEFDKDVQIKREKKIFIGERNQEGYGEIDVCVCDQDDTRYQCLIEKDTSDSKEKKVNTDEHIIAKRICDNLFKGYCKNDAAIKANKWFDSQKANKKDLKPLVSILRLMVDDENNKTLEEVRININDRYDKKDEGKRKKKKLSDTICKNVNEATKDIVETFMEKYSVDGYVCEEMDMMQMDYMKDYLIALKYCFRREMVKEGE